MGNTQSSYLGTVGRGGTSNQTNASFQIGRARRLFGGQRDQGRQMQFDALRGQPGDYTSVGGGPTNLLGRGASMEQGARNSLLALQGWEDTPYGPARTLESAERRLGNRLKGNRVYEGDLLGIAPRRETGADRYYRMRFGES